jgi:uncharacterized repeat protein (TIGR01451 family)
LSGSTAGCTASGQTVTCISAAITAGGTRSFTIHVTVASSVADGTVLKNKGSVASNGTIDQNPANNTSDEASTTVQARADLSITKGAPATAIAGDPLGFNYTLVVTNNGPSDNAGGFTITDVLPAGTTFSLSGSTAGCTASGQTVTCISAAITAGGTRSFTIHVTVDATLNSGAVLSNSASAAPAVGATTDPNNGNNTSSPPTTTTVQEDVRLVIAKAFTEPSVTAGTPGHSFTITVTNNGYSDADNVVVNDSVDSRLVVTGVTGGGFTCDAPSPTIHCTLAHLGPSATETITVTYSAATTNAAPVSNTASVSSEETTPPKTSTATVDITRRSTQTTVVCDTPRVVNQASTCTVTVSDTDTPTKTAPTGDVTFSRSGAGTGTFSGTGTCTLVPAATTSSCQITYTPLTGSGVHTVTASYLGSGLHKPSSGTANITVNLRSTTTTISCIPVVTPINTNMTCTATVTDTESAGMKSSPTGHVNFTKDGGQIGTGCYLVPIAATYSSSCFVTFSSATAQVYLIVANYEGSNVHKPSSSESLPVVFYDPNGGFVTGGGYINHEQGTTNPAAPGVVGKDNFGFNAKYPKNNPTIPTGETEFQCKVCLINFHSTAYEWLVITRLSSTSVKAQYQGTGTINGASGYGFIVTVIDGGQTDTARIRIWNKTTNVTVYDNEYPKPDNADPTTVTAGGNIVVHDK